ncbi:MAG TPA: pyridoxamine 5'-phosphate oxidase [Gammaproteobacteria bacterium]
MQAVDADERGLSRRDLDENPFRQFDGWLREAGKSVSVDEVPMTLSTVSADGQPSQRVVLLKQFDESGFVFYTNLESRKAAEIAGNPKVSLHFAWPVLNRQVSVEGRAEKLSVEEAARYFMSRPRNSRLAAWASRQSRPVSSRQLLEQQFRQIQEKFAEGEIPLPPFWGGFRVVPDCMEFWQSRRYRLHDRFRYRLDARNQGWNIERLSP